MRTFTRRAAVLAAASLLVSACGADPDIGDPTAQAVDEDAPATADEPAAEDGDDPATAGGPAGALDGAGATFPTPVFEEWIFAYADDVNPNALINYQSIGSGGGIEQFLSQTVDFGSSERVLAEDDLQLAATERGCDPIEIPVVFGAVTIAYDEPEIEELVLTGDLIADIFERRITMWNDPAIAELNPGVDLPDKEFIPVHRSDGSGTTSVFTKYLDADTDTWTLGEGTEVQWPSGTIGGEGNEGVSAGITQNDGGIGYINQAYALELGLQTASVVNRDGNAVQPTLEATSAALSAIDIPDDFRFDILGVGGDGYPIAGTNWIFAWECGYDQETADLLIDFWTWAVENGDDLALELGYAPLADDVKPDVLAAIERINAQN
ncbi:phosphate ABC transporter substrate-binding protein PstS [Egicoccus sp. AB-alg6-2]|uniref:phosphate ABC transporter substrate-binding protein PstS n=1 Tax=Egicoccus sp. AB-alg6-2 TaxID=3242692 RepID=UPI00359DC79C